LRVQTGISMYQFTVSPRNDVQMIKRRYESEHSGYTGTALTDGALHWNC